MQHAQLNLKMAPGEVSVSPDAPSPENALRDLQSHTDDADRVLQAVSLLASSSRSDDNVRQQLAEPAILKALTEILHKQSNAQTSDPLAARGIVDPALRCIGNACIDNDAARQALTDIGFKWARSCLWQSLTHDDELGFLLVKVLYNICSDHEPAQQQCYREDMCSQLAQFYGQPAEGIRSRAGFTVMGFELIFWIASHKQPEDELPERSPLRDLTHISTSICGQGHDSDEFDGFAFLLETILVFFRDPREQERLVEDAAFGDVWQTLQKAEELMKGRDEDDVKLLGGLSTSFVWCLSDLAALPSFAQKIVALNPTQKDAPRDDLHEFVLPVIKQYEGKKKYGDGSRVVDAACQVLGNVLWSVKDWKRSEYHLQLDGLYKPLVEMAMEFEQAESLHSVAGLLLQLARHSEDSRDRCLEANVAATLPKLCRHSLPQVKEDGLKLLKALGRDNPEFQSEVADLAKEVMVSMAAQQQAEATDAPVIEAPA